MTAWRPRPSQRGKAGRGRRRWQAGGDYEAGFWGGSRPDLRPAMMLAARLPAHRAAEANVCSSPFRPAASTAALAVLRVGSPDRTWYTVWQVDVSWACAPTSKARPARGRGRGRWLGQGSPACLLGGLRMRGHVGMGLERQRGFGSRELFGSAWRAPRSPARARGSPSPNPAGQSVPSGRSAGARMPPPLTENEHGQGHIGLLGGHIDCAEALGKRGWRILRMRDTTIPGTEKAAVRGVGICPGIGERRPTPRGAV